MVPFCHSHNSFSGSFKMPKLTDISVQRAFSGLILKHLLDQIKIRRNQIFDPLLDQFLPRVMSSHLLTDYALQEFIAATERISMIR